MIYVDSWSSWLKCIPCNSGPPALVSLASLGAEEFCRVWRLAQRGDTYFVYFSVSESCIHGNFAVIRYLIQYTSIIVLTMDIIGLRPQVG